MRIVVLLTCVALAACGKPAEQRETTTLDVQPQSMPDARMAPPPGVVAAPGISVSAAPGVAFRYGYAFRLPNAKISGVQEQHAQACEKLGLDHCRITGMRYTVRDEDDITAMLSFKLDPALARDFGKQGIAAIEKAEGMLIDAEITGTDAGTAISQSYRASDKIRVDLARIEGELKRPGLSASERVELNEQAQALRQQLGAAANDRDAARESLATTPMVFQYNSGNAITGNPLRTAWNSASNSFVAVLGFLIVAIGFLLPWALLAGLTLLVIRPVWKRWRRTTPVVATSID